MGQDRLKITGGALTLIYALLLISAFLCILSTWVVYSFYYETDLPWADWPHPQKWMILADLNDEDNLGAWLSSMLLLTTGLVAIVCLFTEGADTGRLRYGWLSVAAIFVGLSFDEIGSMHERVALAFPEKTWVLWLAPFLIAIPGYMLAFGWFQIKRSKLAFAAIIIGVGFYCTVPLQEHFEFSVSTGSNEYRRQVLNIVLEEGAELFGTLVLFAGVWLFTKISPDASPSSQADPR